MRRVVAIPPLVASRRLQRYDDARSGAIAHLLASAVGVLSICIAAAGGDRWAWLAAVSYSLLGPVLGTWGYIAGSRRERVERDASLAV